MEKKQILSNVSNLSAEQLFSYIQKGEISLPELQATEDLDINKRRKITELLKNFELSDSNEWENARYGNEMALSDYITNNPGGKFVNEAKEKIRQLEAQRRQAKEKKLDVVNKLRKDPNSFTRHEINNLLSNQVITKEDLIDCGIPNSVIEYLNKASKSSFRLGDTPDSIPEGFTEVYFWGIPGSGKTCALAALLSTADKAGDLEIATAPSYDYMTRLKNIFINANAILPLPTPVETTQYLPFTLKKAIDKYPRSVSLIELSGEIFQCFFYKNASLRFPTQSHEDTFESLLKFLDSDNRKIHFFFIDFSLGNVGDNDEYTQSDYLAAASTYFKNNDIFRKTTDAIYVVVTKSDLMPISLAGKDQEDYEKRVNFSKEYLKNNNFSSFTNTLKDRCIKNSINAGKLTVEPFSIGKVYFKDICNFDNASAGKIIEILHERIAQSRTSILDIFNK